MIKKGINKGTLDIALKFIVTSEWAVANDLPDIADQFIREFICLSVDVLKLIDMVLNQ